MSVVLKFNICQSNNCKSFTFTEQTGAYNALSNTTGWGAPNNSNLDAQTATLTITKPDGTQTILNLFPSGFPTINTNLQFIINNTDLGYGSSDTIPDGEFIFVYETTSTGRITFDFIQTKDIFTFCNAKCCVFNMFSNIPENVSCDCCDDTNILKAEKARAFLEGLKFAASCGLKNKFKTLLDTVNKLCKNQNCSSCGQKV